MARALWEDSDALTFLETLDGCLQRTNVVARACDGDHSDVAEKPGGKSSFEKLLLCEIAGLCVL